MMRGRIDTDPWSVVLDAPEAGPLAEFYRDLLGWEFMTKDPEWVTLSAGPGRPYLSFQSNEQFVPPEWPATGAQQAMQLHLDFVVTDLAAATEDAVAAGATVAAIQPQDDVRVLLDPAGHPFCLWVETPTDG